VFRGGFDPAAAEAVAGADPAMLSALVERSLVDRAGGGRYGLHELLRQFAAERLEVAGDAAATRRAHAGHYAGFLAARHDRLADALDTAVLAEVDPETANLRAAWQELAETDGIDAVAGLLEDLWLVHRRHGRFQEALGMLQRALAGDDATPGSGPGGTCGPGSPSTSWGGPRRARRSCGPCSAWPAGPCRRPAPAGPRPLLGAPPARPAAGPSGPGRPPTRTPGRRRPRSPKPTR